MDIKSWKIMLAVDDYGSFTRVGAELGYTQSGITQMMKNLEKKVGFPLYIKDHHGITLTNEAKSLIPAIRTLLNADEVIHQEIAALNGAQRGTIRIGTYLSCSIHWIPKIIREFQQKHPDIIIQVIEGVEGELADYRYLNILYGCHIWQKVSGVFLPHKSYSVLSVLHKLLIRHRKQILAVDIQLSGRRSLKSSDHIEECGLS